MVPAVVPGKAGGAAVVPALPQPGELAGIWVSFRPESCRAAERMRNQKSKPQKKFGKPGKFCKPRTVVYRVHKTK